MQRSTYVTIEIHKITFIGKYSIMKPGPRHISFPFYLFFIPSSALSSLITYWHLYRLHFDPVNFTQALTGGNEMRVKVIARLMALIYTTFHLLSYQYQFLQYKAVPCLHIHPPTGHTLSKQYDFWGDIDLVIFIINLHMCGLFIFTSFHNVNWTYLFMGLLFIFQWL